MNNKLSQAQALTLTAPASGVVSGVPQIIGNLLIIPKSTAAEGEKFAAEYKGEFNLPKVSADTPAQLAKAYFKADSTELTTTSTGNKLVGVFSRSAASGETSCGVILTGEII